MTKMRLVKQVKLANGVLALFGALDVRLFSTFLNKGTCGTDEIFGRLLRA